MPSNAPPPRKKSCNACIKAKRRCDLSHPSCSRCLSKAIPCHYASQGFSISGRSKEIHGSISTSSNDSITEIDQMELNFGFLPENDLQHDVGPGISVLELWAPPRTINADPARVKFVTQYLKSLPEKLVDTGGLPFLHPRLWALQYPGPVQEAFAACAVYCARNEATRPLVFSIVGEKAKQILNYRAYQTWSIEDKLANLQALIIVQIIRLWDGDIQQRTIAEQDEETLFEWTKELYELSKHPIENDSSPWRNWLLLESLHRTIIVALMIQGTYDVEKTGICRVRPGHEYAKSVPFNPLRGLWSAHSSYEWQRARSAVADGSWLKEVCMGTMLQAYCTKPPLDEFGTLMLSLDLGTEAVQKWDDESISLEEIYATSVSATAIVVRHDK